MGGESKIIWNPYTKGYYDNPYPHINKCREENPIHKGVHNSWMFFQHKDVSKILRSNDFLVSDLSQYFKEKEPYLFKENGCPYLSKGTQMWPMYLNDKKHKNIRSVMGKSFMELDLNTALVESVEIVNKQFIKHDSFNLVSYCSQFVYLVIMKFFGFEDLENFDELKKYSNMLAKSQDLFIPKQVYKEINLWFLWGNKMLSNSNPSYKKSIESISNKMGLNYSEEEVNSIMAISIMAAIETSKDNLTVALLEMLKNKDLIDVALNSNTKELNLLIEELFRFSTPLQYTVRVNKKEMQYGEINIPENSKLYLCLASANRDSLVFDNPDKIIANRTTNNHLAFGGGSHFCLGAQLARQEMRYCLKPMLNFLKNYEIDKERPVQWSKQIFMRTLESVEVKK